MTSDDAIPLEKRTVKKLAVGQKKLVFPLSEDVQIEDEVVLGFLTNDKKREDFFQRNGFILGSESLLNQLENLLNNNSEKVRGRPYGSGKKPDPNFVNEKLSFYLNIVQRKYLVDYAKKHRDNSEYDALRRIIREALLADGFIL